MAIAVARAMAMRMASQLRAVLVPRMPLLLVKSWGSCACRMRPQMRVAMSMRAMLAVVTMARRWPERRNCSFVAWRATRKEIAAALAIAASRKMAKKMTARTIVRGLGKIMWLSLIHI